MFEDYPTIKRHRKKNEFKKNLARKNIDFSKYEIEKKNEEVFEVHDEDKQKGEER